MRKSEIQKVKTLAAETVTLNRKTIRTVVRLHWNPGKLDIPPVPEDLQSLDPIARGGEVIRYAVLRVEYWMSPHGLLREWLRWNLAASLSLAIPALFIVPTVTLLLGEFVTWTALLMQIFKNLLMFPVLAGVFIALTSGVLIVIRALVRTKR